MYEPYPHRIHRGKVTAFVLMALFLFIGLGYSYFNKTPIIIAEPYHQLLEYIGYVLLFMLTLFCFKAYSFKQNRDYLLLGAASIIILLHPLLIHLSPAILNISPETASNLANIHFEYLAFAILLLLTAFDAGKVAPLKRRRLQALLAVVIPIIIFLGISFGLLYRILVIYDLTQLRQPLKLIIALITLWAGVKFGRLYYKKSHNIYYWFLVAVLFFLFSVIYLLFEQIPNDAFSFISSICLQIAIFALIQVTFEEHSRFMESEIEVRRSLEKSLLKTEKNLETYRNLVDSVDVGIFVVDEEGLVIFSNNRLGQMFDISKEKLIGKKQAALFDETNLEKFLIEREKWASGLKSQYEIELLDRRGKNIPVLISSVPIKDRWGRFRGSRNVVIEITAYKEFERELKKYSTDLEKRIQERTDDLNQKTEEWKRAKTYYETLISGMLDILLVVDKQGNCIFINDYGKKVLGFDAAELNQKKLPNFFADMENLQKNYGDAMKIELRDYEAELNTKSGQKLLCSWNVRYLFDHQGKGIGAMCVGRDISEYKAMQKKLEDHSKNLEQEVIQRTAELNLKVKELEKILKIGEDIILNVNLSDILSNICQAIQSIGWKKVVITLRQEDGTSAHVAAFSGISPNRLRKFMAQKEVLFKNTLKYLRDEYRVGRFYIVDHQALADPDLNVQGIKKSNDSNHRWHHDDVLICPVRIKKKILGFIMVFEPVDGLRPNDESTQILEIFAHKAAVAIENNSLFKEIQARAKDLENANRIKSEYFTNMSHELRTPLNSILTLTSILLQKMTGELNSEQLRQIRIIKRNGERLLKLINTILDLSKIEAGKMDVNYSYFPLLPVLQASIETIRPLCDKKGLKLELKVEKNTPEYIFSDKDKIDHVLTNLLSNSVKFTDRGKIMMSVSRDKFLDIHIRDTGIGMEKSEIENIFQPFHQLESSDDRQKAGTGLGLSISKQLWEMIGGQISIQSKKDKGTLVHLQLPLKETGEIEKEIDLTNDGDLPIIDSSHQKLSRTQKRILLVDDNLDNQYALKFILTDKGYQISFAQNGEEGIKKAIKEKPALILMDMMMPGIDGYQAVKTIRAHKELAKIPIIAMTAKTVVEDKGRAMQAGCSDYLPKPFSLDDLVKKVQKWIGETK